MQNISSQLSVYKINDVRYNESPARTYTLREEKWSSMSFTLWVRIIATDTYSALSGSHTRTHIPYTIHQYCMHNPYTHTATGNVEHCGASVSKHCGIELWHNCYVAKALPVKYETTAHRLCMTYS